MKEKDYKYNRILMKINFIARKGIVGSASAMQLKKWRLCEVLSTFIFI